jgi:hypothetical protein
MMFSMPFLAAAVDFDKFGTGKNLGSGAEALPEIRLL